MHAAARHLICLRTLYIFAMNITVAVVACPYTRASVGVCLQRCARFGCDVCCAVVWERRIGLFSLSWSCLLDFQCRPPRHLCPGIRDNKHTHNRMYIPHETLGPCPSPFGGTSPPLHEMIARTSATTAAIMELTPEPRLACVTARRSVPQHVHTPAATSHTYGHLPPMCALAHLQPGGRAIGRLCAAPGRVSCVRLNWGDLPRLRFRLVYVHLSDASRTAWGDVADCALTAE